MPDQTFTEACEMALERLRASHAQLGELLGRMERARARLEDDLDWGVAGTLGHVETQLAEALRSLAELA